MAWGDWKGWAGASWEEMERGEMEGVGAMAWMDIEVGLSVAGDGGEPVAKVVGVVGVGRVGRSAGWMAVGGTSLGDVIYPSTHSFVPRNGPPVGPSPPPQSDVERVGGGAWEPDDARDVCADAIRRRPGPTPECIGPREELCEV